MTIQQSISVPPSVIDSLPSSFVWGTATAAYQVEGAFDKDGRSLSIWDTFSRKNGTIVDHSSGDVADDQYHLYAQDFKLLKSYGCMAYRMSISWSRILPMGGKGTKVNMRAIDHYNKVFDSLLENGIEPWVTLYHWDLPQILDDEYSGPLDTQRFVADFVNYAETCFKHFGHKIKHWMTFNEPHTFCKLGYGYDGPHAPGKIDNSSIDVWRCGHSVILAHAYTVESFRKNFKPKFGGQISMALNSDWFEPFDDDIANVKAAQRRLDFMLGWFADPIYKTGDYPESMKLQLGERLPTFTDGEKSLVKGSWDYFGLNSYTSRWVKDSGVVTPDIRDLDGNNIATEYGKDGQLIGNKGEASWLYDVPWGFGKLLAYVKTRYGNPPVVITENGFCAAGEKTVEDAIIDHDRLQYYRGYLSALVGQVKENGNIVGYFAWSMLDNFEWARGYTERFGITYVDFKTQKRTPKASAKFLKAFFDVAIRDDPEELLSIREKGSENEYDRSK